MAQYTIEDIEILRQKSGISYEEAVNLLEYHNGSLARALVDLEKNGRLHKQKADSTANKGAKGIFDLLYRLRLKVKKNDVTVINLSSLFMLFVLITAPHVCIVGVIVALLLGYRFRVERDCREFEEDSFDSIVNNAKHNVKNTVNSFSKQFTGEKDQTKSKPEPQESEKPRAQSAPSGTKPVNVQFPGGGNVNVRDDGDGYHEADIE
ncbi:MAG: DUF4342 domain-containing protein [Clostridia bacterium]